MNTTIHTYRFLVCRLVVHCTQLYYYDIIIITQYFNRYKFYNINTKYSRFIISVKSPSSLFCADLKKNVSGMIIIKSQITLSTVSTIVNLKTISEKTICNCCIREVNIFNQTFLVRQVSIFFGMKNYSPTLSYRNLQLKVEGIVTGGINALLPLIKKV